MSGIKTDPVRDFYRALHARGETTATLAAALGLQCHSYVSRLVNGHGRRRGSIWWPRLAALLTPAERQLIAPDPVYTFPTVAAAVAALPPAAPSRGRMAAKNSLRSSRGKPPLRDAALSPTPAPTPTPTPLRSVGLTGPEATPTRPRSDLTTAFTAWKHHQRSA